MKIIIEMDETHGEETVKALRFAIIEIVGRARRVLAAMGCHPDRQDDSHFNGVSRDMGYVRSLKRLLTDIEAAIKGGAK